eukprot:gene13714-2476_t
MGADLFESFVGSVVAACVLGAAEFGEKGVALPLYISCVGLIVSVFCTMHVRIPRAEEGKQPGMRFWLAGALLHRELDTCPASGTRKRRQTQDWRGLHELLMALTYNIIVAGALIIACVIILCVFLFKEEANFLLDTHAEYEQRQPGWRLQGCVILGLLAGVFIGKVTEYYTSHTDEPTQSIARAGEYGPGPVVIQGLGQGMYSTVVPLTLILSTVLGSYYMAGPYGTAIAAVGMLSTLGVTMSTDAYGPVSDNAGGIAEMTGLPAAVRECTDELDALGNTTAATGKGFSNGSAVLAAISLLAAYARMANIEAVDMMKPVVVCGIIFGALQPYVFGAMTMLSVNRAAQEMMAEVRRQWNIVDENGKTILDDDGPKPDYHACIQISTDASLKEMLPPGVLAVFCPLIVGFTFGSHALAGFLLGAIASGYLLGVQMSNTGGAWDNAKKYTEAGGLRIKGVTRPKKTLEHAAVVVGDTIGDPFERRLWTRLMTQFSFVVGGLLDDGWRFWYGCDPAEEAGLEWTAWIHPILMGKVWVVAMSPAD